MSDYQHPPDGTPLDYFVVDFTHLKDMSEDEIEAEIAKTTTTIKEKVRVYKDEAQEEAEFFQRHPRLTELERFSLVYKANPWAMLGMLTTRALCALGANVYLPAYGGPPASPNFYIGLVAPSGKGKGNATGTSYRFGTFTNEAEKKNIGSGEGIAQAFLELVPNPTGQGPRVLQRNDLENILINVAEVTMFGSLAGRTGATIGSVIRSGWSGEDLGNLNATAAVNRQVDADSYRLAMVIGIQPRQAGVLFDDLSAGGPQRILFMPARKPAYVEIPSDAEFMWAEKLAARSRTFSIPTYDGKHYVKVAESVKQFILSDGYLSDIDGDPLDSHAVLLRMKLALGLNLLMFGEAEITEESWDMSSVVMRVHRRTRNLCVEGAREERLEQGRMKGEMSGAQLAESDEVREEMKVEKCMKTITDYLSLKIFNGEPVKFVDVQQRVPGRLRTRKNVNDLQETIFDQAMQRLEELGVVDVLWKDKKTGEAWTPEIGQKARIEDLGSMVREKIITAAVAQEMYQKQPILKPGATHTKWLQIVPENEVPQTSK